MRMAGTIRRTIIGQGFILVALMFDLETLWRDANEVIYYSTSASLRERPCGMCLLSPDLIECLSSKQQGRDESEGSNRLQSY